MRHYPSVSAYPVDDLIARIQTIVERASLAVEVILLSGADCRLTGIY
jgi:predicted lysophospholipase L1 biosynthesis ABC-type transport system permease subunit